MQRCVAIHANGTSEVLEFRPKLHQELRHLGYRRFVVRTGDKRALSAAVYARTTPSAWQFADAARKLWGLIGGDVEAFDEGGERVTDAHDTAGHDARERFTTGAYLAQSAELLGTDERVALASAANGPLQTTPASTSRPEAQAPARTRIDVRQIPELIARANRSLPDSDPRKITAERLEDLLRAASSLRRTASSLKTAAEVVEVRDLSERLEQLARALAGYVRPADAGETAPGASSR